jgi:hypothetical protein
LRGHDKENTLIFLSPSRRCVNVLEDGYKAPDGTKHGVNVLGAVTALCSEGHCRTPCVGKERGAGALQLFYEL